MFVGMKGFAGSVLLWRRPGAVILFGSILVPMLFDPAIARPSIDYDGAFRAHSHGPPARDAFTARARGGRAAQEGAQIAQSPPSVSAGPHPADNGGRRSGGVLESISRWQACFTREKTSDLDAVVAACDLLARSSDLPASTREWAARRRVMLREFKARMQEKNASDGGAPDDKR